MGVLDDVRGIGLGLAALGRPAYINVGRDLGADRSVEALRARTHEVLDAARAAGVTYFDAARSYGKAEEFLGGWLRERGIAPGELTVGSKWGYRYTAGWRLDAPEHEVKDLSADHLRAQLEETRAHLGDHLRLYQIHSATVESGVLEDTDVLGELAALRASGVAVGLTVTGPRQADTIDVALTTGAFDTVQATWNLHERSAEQALARAHAAGLGVIVKEAMANGRLASDPGDAIALAAALAQPWSDVVLSGASSVAMLRSNLRAREVAAGVTARFEQLREAAEDYWSERSALEWN
jgi:aryl-alcohol dehydrogenase-like predicted oxidoreductase